MSEILIGVLRMPPELFWSDDDLTRLQHDNIRREAADEIERLQAENAALKARTVAPTDNGIAYLDSICSKFNDGKIDLGALVCRIWNNRQKEVGALEARVAELEAKIENIFFEFQHWTIIYNPKPIPPSCGVDWDFVHAEYDGENGLAGTGKDPADCLRQIIELMRGANQ